MFGDLPLVTCPIGNLRWEDVWPPYGIKLSWRGITLRPVRPADAVGLGRILDAGILPPSQYHFMGGMFKKEAVNEAAWARQVLRYEADLIRRWRTDSWKLQFAVSIEDRLIGCQSIEADKFPSDRCFETGSYLAAPVQGRGIGRIMRAMIIEFGFRCLDGRVAVSGYHPENAASAAVSRHLGYQATGCQEESWRDQTVRYQIVSLSSDNWPTHRPDGLDEMQISGIEAFKQFIDI